MYRNVSTGLALVITIIALLGFSVLAFLGMEYLFKGDHVMAITPTLIGILFLTWSVYAMCKSKASRNKRKGLFVELFSFIVAAVLLLAGSIPFTLFVSALHREKQFIKTIEKTAEQVSTIDQSYREYANNRIGNYQKILKKKHISSSGIEARSKSLRRRLFPENIDSICEDRKLWLGSLKEVSIWNISTAKNLNYIISAGDDWIKQYQELSGLFYEGEEVDSFKIDESAMVARNEFASLSTPRLPDKISLSASLGCIMLILTSYFHIRRPKNKYSGHHN